jgi:hypothetical protein
MRDVYQIYEDTYGYSTDKTNYYLASIKILNNKSTFISSETHWIGWENKHEIRQINLVDPDRIRKNFDSLGYPIAIIKNTNELLSHLNFGGHVLIPEELMLEH